MIWDDNSPPQVTVEQQAPQFGLVALLGPEIEQAARLPTGAIDNQLPIQSVSVSRAKLIVPLRRAADVHAANPELASLWDLCRRQDTTGAYLFAPHPDGRSAHVVAREFPVDAGYPEETKATR